MSVSERLSTAIPTRFGLFFGFSNRQEHEHKLLLIVV